MHRMHRIFPGYDEPLFPGIRNPASGLRRSQLPLQERPVLLILCILCIDVQFSVVTSPNQILINADYWCPFVVRLFLWISFTPS